MKPMIKSLHPLLPGLLLVAALHGCMPEERKTNMYFGNDFDNYRNWGYDHVSLYDEDAYSGRYCCKTDDANNYSMGLKLDYNDLKRLDAKKFTVSGYVKSTKTHPDAFIVASFDEDTYSLAWNGIELNKEILIANDWTFVSATYDVPKNIYDGIALKVFLWNKGGQTILIDNLTVEFFK